MFPQAAPPAPRPELAPRPAVPQHLVPAPRPESTPSDIAADGLPLPGSSGEHLLQCAYGTQDRATRFYTDQVRSYLLPSMVEFVTRMELVFVATSDGRGECDASLRAGPPGFVRVLDERHLAYPEYRGNGVHASLGNITENPHVGLLMIDFVKDAIGLHVNGRAKIVDDATLRAEHPDLPEDAAPGRRPLGWPSRPTGAPGAPTTRPVKEATTSAPAPSGRTERPLVDDEPDRRPGCLAQSSSFQLSSSVCGKMIVSPIAMSSGTSPSTSNESSTSSRFTWTCSPFASHHAEITTPPIAIWPLLRGFRDGSVMRGG
jgi:predicted pyridoxine 5'-phosphate oxidase superfamily flavin-nucleotide-binding protein